jgi:3-oxoacyl-[acyl-carrier-protein] synthase III
MTQNVERAGMKSLAVSYPRQIRTNDYFRQKYPEMVANAETKTLAKIWAAPDDAAVRVEAFDAEMAPYLKDPFRGAVRRRVLSEGESALTLEVAAARAAIEAAHMKAGDIDLLIVCSFRADTIGVGNAPVLAAELGLTGAAWNLETACSGSVVALQTAAALVRAGEYRNILVVTSCTYSRDADEGDSLSWFLGDGAGAFVVGPTTGGEGVLGGTTIHTADTCGAFRYELVTTPAGRPTVRMLSGASAGKVLRESSITYLRQCCDGALRAAKTKLSDIDFFVFNTPTAWYARFCARSLGIPPEATIDTYPLYANMGPALMPTNLYRAVKSGRIKRDALVLLYAIGSASTASATVMKLGEVALGPDPEEALR